MFQKGITFSLQKKKQSGIKSIIENNYLGNYSLLIGFNNDVISIMSERVKNEGIDDFKEVYIRAAYKFSKNEEEFIDSLYFNYAKDHSFFKQLILHEATNKFLRESYYRVRNTSDTLRAIYRMSVIGIIDDYVIDYVGGFIKVFLRGRRNQNIKRISKNTCADI